MVMSMVAGVMRLVDERGLSKTDLYTKKVLSADKYE
jgi:hypothetical protein